MPRLPVNKQANFEMSEEDSFPTAYNHFPIIFNTCAVKRSPNALHESHLY